MHVSAGLGERRDDRVGDVLLEVRRPAPVGTEVALDVPLEQRRGLLGYSMTPSKNSLTVFSVSPRPA
jgi:hypothetical protein